MLSRHPSSRFEDRYREQHHPFPQHRRRTCIRVSETDKWPAPAAAAPRRVPPPLPPPGVAPAAVVTMGANRCGRPLAGSSSREQCSIARRPCDKSSAGGEV